MMVVDWLEESQGLKLENSTTPDTSDTRTQNVIAHISATSFL